MNTKTFSQTVKQLLCALVAIVCIGDGALAKVDVALELTRADILRPDQSVSADVHEREATISTYTNKSSQNKDAVCRFDALLIAKKVSELVPTLKKVRVWFHEYTGHNYREVVVATDDLKAFENHKIKQDQLLARLKVRQCRSVESSESFFAKQPAPTQPEVGGIKTGTGVAFYYPKGWRMQPVSGLPGELAAVTSGGRGASTDVTLAVVHKNDAKEDKSAKTIRVGYGPGASALDSTSTYDSQGVQHIERRVFFTDGKYQYKMTLVCKTDDFSRANVDFNYMLSTLNLRSAN